MCLLKQRASLSNLSILNIELGQIVIGVVVSRFQFQRLLELFSSQMLRLPGANRPLRDWFGPSPNPVSIAHRRFEVLTRLRILRQ